SAIPPTIAASAKERMNSIQNFVSGNSEIVSVDNRKSAVIANNNPEATARILAKVLRCSASVFAIVVAGACTAAGAAGV
ncbi:MAG: hypothetical protein RMM53_11080, partial [Bacteroidia bacterium]|nr:hypothetical protein [Bacteroidia bacterium]